MFPLNYKKARAKVSARQQCV